MQHPALKIRRANARPLRLALAAAGRLFALLIEWQWRAGERQHLASLTDGQLKDIGLSRADIMFEADKPFWRR